MSPPNRSATEPATRRLTTPSPIMRDNISAPREVRIQDPHNKRRFGPAAWTLLRSSKRQQSLMWPGARWVKDRTLAVLHRIRHQPRQRGLWEQEVSGP